MQHTQWVTYQGIKVRLLMLQRIHESGNKYFKLALNLEKARTMGCQSLLTFGGAWSNHIHAVATAGAEGGFQTIGVIRGERPESLSATLRDAEQLGMRLHFVSRSDYRRRNEPEFLQYLTEQLGESYLVPEGGSNALGVEGAEAIAEYIPATVREVLVAVGTGGTLAGISRKLSSHQRITGVCVLKGAEALNKEVTALKPAADNWTIDHAGHYGGYARCSSELQQFIVNFEAATGVLLEPVYTAKLLYRLFERVRQGLSNPEEALVIHTGGLQGRRGFNFLSQT